MRNKIAQVNNIRLLTAAGRALSTRDIGVPGIGLIWGPTGFGKSTAAAWFAIRTNAVYVRAMATWTPTAMLAAIMHELDAKPLPRCAAMIEFIVGALAREGRPLFVDEADYLAASAKLLDSLRDLHDMSTVPLILIGMKDFQRRVMHREQIAGRVSQWVEFQAADFKDARILADEVCEVRIADDLLARLHRATGGSMRGMVVGLSRIEGFAREHGLQKVSETDWGERAFVLSQAPKAPKINIGT